MKLYRLVIAAGNYDLTHYARSALIGRYAVTTAFSHRDTLYALRSACDLILVDAAMYDRHSGEQTAEVVCRTYPDLPVIVYIGDQTNGWERRLGEIVPLTSTDERAVNAAVSRALKRVSTPSRPQPRPDTRPIYTEPLWRSEEIKTLFALGRSLTEVLELSEVLNRVVEAARRLTAADEGMILLPDQDTGDLYLRARVGIDSDVARNFRIKTRDSLAGHVFNTGEPVVVGARGPQKVKTEYFVNALLYVPILVKGKPIGVLGVNNRAGAVVFTPRDQELLVNLASYAAVAIENARVHGQMVKRARELKSLADAAQAINASLVMEHTLPTICWQMMRVMDVPYAEILDWQPKHARLSSLAFHSALRWRSGHEFIRDLRGFTTILRLLARGEGGLIERANDTLSAREREWLAHENADSVLVLPIRKSGQTIGAALFFYVGTAPELRALDAARLHSTALEIAVTAPTGMSSALMKMIEDTNSETSAAWSEITLFQADTRTLLTYARVGGSAYANAKLRWTLDVREERLLTEALEAQETIVIAEGQQDLSDVCRALLRHTKSRSVLCMPLVQRGQTTGLMLFCDSDANRQYSVRERDLARAVIGQAATALDNARLVSDLESSLIELRQTQARLIQSARLSAMGELAAAVAHQINNPLTTIVLDTELLQDNAALDAETKTVLQAIERAGKRAASVVRRMLATVRPTSSDSVTLVPLNVLQTVEDTVALVRSHIERSHIRLTVSITPEATPPVMAIPGELDDVWLNLLLNAHDALVGRPKPTIEISAAYQPSEGYIVVTVVDNGPGIPEAIAQDIFKPFFTTKPVGEGTGLGLHICKQVVDRVGGQIAVESTPQSGTRFMVRLPVHISSPEEPQ